MSGKKTEGVATAPVVAAPKGRSLASFAPSRWVIGLLLVLAGFGAGWRLLWTQVRQHVLAGAEYRLSPENIQITPPPKWIRSDIKAEVLRDASLDSTLSILEEDVTVRMAQAFSLHPWVASVKSVCKRRPTGLDVELIYRTPAAMVEVSGGLLPVDAEGVLLPSDDFSPADARNFPRLSDIKTAPLGPIGTRWGDARVAGGAKLAALFADSWQKLNLSRIVAQSQTSVAGVENQNTFELLTHLGSRVLWGHAPGAEGHSEMSAPQKLHKLLEYAQSHSSLEGADGRQHLDLRAGHDMLVTPRGPIASLPLQEPVKSAAGP